MLLPAENQPVMKQQGLYIKDLTLKFNLSVHNS